MGSKYQVRTEEATEFSSVTDYYVNSLFELIKLIIKKRGKIIFITKQYY